MLCVTFCYLFAIACYFVFWFLFVSLLLSLGLGFVVLYFDCGWWFGVLVV